MPLLLSLLGPFWKLKKEKRKKKWGNRASQPFSFFPVGKRKSSISRKKEKPDAANRKIRTETRDRLRHLQFSQSGSEKKRREANALIPRILFFSSSAHMLCFHDSPSSFLFSPFRFKPPPPPPPPKFLNCNWSSPNFLSGGATPKKIAK